MKKKKQQTNIMDIFDKKRNKVDILFIAIDAMQQYNGRTVEDCLELAMGYTRNADGNLVKEKD